MNFAIRRAAAAALAAALVAPVAAPVAAHAEETPITVRVLSEGAKFIGDTMGGLRITLHDAATGEVLASGRTRGGTGDTERIMSAQPRGATLATEDAAKFETTLDLDEPTRVRLVAHGPLAQPQAANTIEETRTVLPGRGISGGDGWLLEMPGLVVDVLGPPAPTTAEAGGEVFLTANVALMCGCPIGPDTAWPVEDYEVAATLVHDGETVRTVPLAYAGTPSHFGARLTLDEPGTWRIAVHAWQETTGNAGVDYTVVTVPDD